MSTNRLQPSSSQPDAGSCRLGDPKYRSIGRQTVIFRAFVLCRHPQVLPCSGANPDDGYVPVRPSGCATNRRRMAGNRDLSLTDWRRSRARSRTCLIHDAARPFVTAAVISRAIEAAGRTGAAVPAIPVTDTTSAGRRTNRSHAERARLRIAQTPQAFRSMLTPIAAPRARAATISPTTRRLRNGRD